MNIRRIIFSLALILLVHSGWSQAAQAANEASGFVQNLSDQAMGVLQDDSGSLAQRETQFRIILVEGFDLKLIGRFVLGGYWRKANEDQRENYLRAFGEFIVRKYSAMLGGYAGEKMTVVSEQAAGEKDIIVRTRIDRPSGPPIEADWRVRGQGGTLRIIDVMVEGISMAVTQRAEFRSVVRRHGIDGLIQILDAQSSKLSATAAAN
ncbi:MAG: ABC transporter substrate-binding protein [Alphaproteobacteria bacterium]|jgi:phospholipid transport system substrate-binding protein|nr:ABC transporter substrate-binding protein [Alphaproteobacteria bacterium]MDP6588273.1 ABC transporter substrate-binding protein [Alphaproteobacteria bacterium]MDP6817701.1 ABC transporter substrate-binding protein [Alphaproteobacteria bacterium]|tara:strand:- start:894 stop:1514 length:621 start_codon:yes stop_codon:yes gene_type:complete